MNKTPIEYLTHTWNPIAMRCTPISAGCSHCWHLTMANRLCANWQFDINVREAYGGGPPVLIPERLAAPVRRKKPAIIGVQLMGDLFHDLVEWNWQYKVFEMMALAQHHTFIILTKRPKPETIELISFHLKRNYAGLIIPLPNVWLGVSVENQKTADERIPILLQTPAAKRVVSIEPMLGPVDISEYLRGLKTICQGCVHFRQQDYCYITKHNLDRNNTVCFDGTIEDDRWTPAGLDWVIAGCESGPNRRPAQIEWFRDLKNQCVDAGVPYFLKQMEIEGQIVKMPFIDGAIWNQMP